MQLGAECQFENDPTLKWRQAEVTIANSVTWYGEHVHYMLNRLMRRAVAEWMSPVMFPSTEFRVLDSNPVWFQNINAAGDILLRSEYIDGQNGVLGYVPLPVGTNDVGACERCGDVFFDQWEQWTTRMWYSFFLHEFGHALGLGHSNRRDSIMWPTFQGLMTIGESDRADVVRLYERAAA